MMDEKAIQKAWNMMSMHNSELLLENEQLKKRLMRQSFWYAIKRAINIWRGKDA
jgi:regulator of replication initiation timing